MATEEDVRRIALSMPEVTEKPWFNTLRADRADIRSDRWTAWLRLPGHVP